jgi:hypothetical protein
MNSVQFLKVQFTLEFFWGYDNMHAGCMFPVYFNRMFHHLCLLSFSHMVLVCLYASMSMKLFLLLYLYEIIQLPNWSDVGSVC